jgi:gliding motility-associated-like protein
MKRLVTAAFISAALLLLNCSKNDNKITLTNCDGLVTDTAGTYDNGRIYMPNAFSPNSDGINDVCRPITQNISTITFTIYDENNTVVYTTNQLGQGWQPATAGNTSVKYYYKIQTTTFNNRNIGTCGEVYKLTCFPTNVPVSTLKFEDQLTPFGFTGVTSESLATCP